MVSFQATELYNQKAFITHAALLRQGCPHCAKFLTAASRRSLGRVPVPVWLIILSDQLDIVDNMVGHYPTINLMSRRLIPKRSREGPFTPDTEVPVVLSRISASFETLFQT